MQAINQAVKNAVTTIQPHDSRERFESLGCEVITGEASFISPSEISVAANNINAKTITAKKIVVATGSYAWIPPVEGLDQVDYLTNEDMFSLPHLPQRLTILGGGPVGVEMAQAYARLGSEVTIIELAARLLPRGDEELSDILAQALQAEGVRLELAAEVERVSQLDGVKKVELKNGNSIDADALLVAVGRRPCVDSLNLQSANVDFDARGIQVDRKMRTSNKRIYACGDVTGEMPLTHVAELQAGIIIANMMFKLPKKISYDVVPAVVYTEPEVAQVGLSVEQCEALKHGEVHRFEVAELDRAVTDNAGLGVAKILTVKGKVVGAHIIAPHAGELIHELALAVQQKMHISKITSLVHAYPSYSQLNKRVAGHYYKDRLFSGFSKRIVRLLW
jgi:pyruvate/2-oxoglutarate dehydrogenase complex dihydrolipoamide dehydrogenase (E3) component